MPDDDNTVVPLWKRNLRPPTPETRSLQAETRRRDTAIKDTLLTALHDRDGAVAFWLGLKHGSAEDRRCFANIVAKMVPLEVQGSLDHSLTVRVVTQLGTETSLKIGVGYRPPKDVTDVELPPGALDQVAPSEEPEVV